MESDFLGQQFKYSGKEYCFQCGIESTDGKNSVGFDSQEVTMFSYENKLNSLCLHARLIYTDKYGMVDRVLDEELPICNVFFVRNVPINDGKFTIRKFSDTEVFKHRFLVDGVKILNRLGTRVTYEFKLVSESWFKCIKNVSYTNYDKGPESIFDIFKACLVQNGLPIDTPMFDKVKTDAKTSFITSSNDNLFTIQKYLFHKLYYNDNFDDALKYFLFDLGKEQYTLFDIQRPETKTGDHSIILSMLASSSETMTEQEPNNFGMVSQLPRQKTLLNFIDHQFYNYDITTNEFVDKTVPAEKIIDLYNKYVPKCHNENGIPRIDSNVRKTLKESGYSCSSSYWNSDQDIYDDMTGSLNKDNSFIVNTSGNIALQPGCYVNIIVERRNQTETDESHAYVDNQLQRYMAFEGLWIASKIENIIEPAIGKYRQNIWLMHNFKNDNTVKAAKEMNTPSTLVSKLKTAVFG